MIPSEYEENLRMQGITLEQFYKFTNSSEEALKAQMHEEAEKRVAGLERTFEVTKALVDVVDNKEICFQEITYETYIKPKTDVEQAVDDT